MAGLLYGCVAGDGRKERKRRNFRHLGFTVDGYTNEELRSRYRFGLESIIYITNLLEASLRRKTKRNNPLSVLQQVLIALRFYASGSFLQVVGDTVGVDKSTVSEGCPILSNRVHWKIVHNKLIDSFYLSSGEFLYSIRKIQVSIGLLHLISET